MSPLSYAALALAAPLFIAALLTVAPVIRNARLAAPLLSITAALVSLLSSVGMTWSVSANGAAQKVIEWMPGAKGPLAEIGLRADGISAAMMIVVTLVALCVQVFSYKYLEGEPLKAIGRYYAYQSLFVVAMGILVVAPNLLQLFMGWELVGLASYLLIGHYFRKPSAARAAVKAFWVTKLADVGLLLALLVIHAETGTFRWDVPLSVGAATLAGLLLLFAVAGKSAQFPLHVWLPDAMEGPTPVSALLHAATMVAAGVYLVVRAYPVFELGPAAAQTMAWLGAFTALFAAFAAVAQTDLKKMLAYSTCSQLGYMLAGLGAGALFGGYFHLVTHAAFKALLFLAAGNVIHAVHSNEMAKMGGLGKKMRWTQGAFIIGALALAGIPGLSGGFSKELLLEGMAQKGAWGPLLLLLAAVPVTALYVARAVTRVFFGAPSEAAHHADEAPASMLGPVLLLAVPSLALGFAGAAFAAFVGQPWGFHLSALGLGATALALAGGAVGILSAGKGAFAATASDAIGALQRFAERRYVDRAWELAFHKALLPVAAVAAWFDRYIVDALINVLGASVLSGAQRSRPVQTGNVRDYLLAVGGSVALLALWGVFQ